ncbi:hypothetical protein ACFL2S_01755 [Thermodesulfobacteriota bacterium]
MEKQVINYETMLKVARAISHWEAWKNNEIRKANVAEFKDYLVGETEYEHYSLGLPLE